MLNAISGKAQVLLADSAANLFYMAETFKQRMVRLRKRVELHSQAAAAAKIGCERGTVSMWEAPSSTVEAVGGEYLLAVAHAYKVRPEYINSGKGDDGFPWDGKPSQSVTLDAETVQDVAQSMQDILSEKDSGYQGVQDAPELFIELYHKFLKGETSPYQTAATAVRWMDERQGAKSDVRVAPVPDSGTSKGKAGTHRKAKR